MTDGAEPAPPTTAAGEPPPLVVPATPSAIADAAGLLRRGGLVAFPTETVYGLGANARDADAVARIFAAKGRPAFNPLIVHVPDVAAARALAAEWPPVADRLATLWPGPLTLVVRRGEAIPDIVTAGRDTVGVRVPAHPVALALLRAADRPLAAPSANRYTRISPTTAAHVAHGLGDRVDRILDGGPTDVGIESTVVDVTRSPPVVLRPGSLTLDALSAAAGEPVVARAAEDVAADAEGAHARSAPGLVARHYAPEADVWLVAPDGLPDAQAALRADPRPTGAVLVRGTLDLPEHLVHRLSADPAAYARGLYAALYALEAAGAARIVIERPPDGEAWRGVHDRLARASH